MRLRILSLAVTEQGCAWRGGRYLGDKRDKSRDFARLAAATLLQVQRLVCTPLSMASRYSVARAVWLCVRRSAPVSGPIAASPCQ